MTFRQDHGIQRSSLTFGLERVTRIELALSAWEVQRSAPLCCVTCVAASPSVTVTAPFDPGLIAR
jgi:hypothetical protein